MLKASSTKKSGHFTGRIRQFRCGAACNVCVCVCVCVHYVTPTQPTFPHVHIEGYYNSSKKDSVRGARATKKDSVRGDPFPRTFPSALCLSGT
jgi:hypothetical protein